MKSGSVIINLSVLIHNFFIGTSDRISMRLSQTSQRALKMPVESFKAGHLCERNLACKNISQESSIGR